MPAAVNFADDDWPKVKQQIQKGMAKLMHALCFALSLKALLITCGLCYVALCRVSI